MNTYNEEDMQYIPVSTVAAHDVRDCNGNVLEADVVPANVARMFEHHCNMLRLIIVRACSALHNGSFVRHDASIEFMQGIPDEIHMHVTSLTAERDAYAVQVQRLESALRDALRGEA